MAAIIWTDVTAIAADLTAVSTAAQTLILAFVNEALDTRLFYAGEDSPRLKLARIYLAAHYAAIGIGGSTGAVGPVTSESVGGLSRSYGQMSTSSSDPLLESTSWGRAYRLLIRPLRGGIAL